MRSLHDVQRAFSAAALFGDTEALATLGIAAHGLKPAARIEIYRASILGNYRRALAATFPVVERLVGASFFAAATERFARDYPSTRGDINRYGRNFATFLDTYPPAHELAYLPDVARLEWAIDQANIACDAPTLDLEALACVPAQLYGKLRFSLNPSAQLIASEFPILHIWKANQPECDGDERIDLSEGGETLLVQRRLADAGGIAIERIPVEDHRFLALLAAGGSLDDTASRCRDASAKFDLAAALKRYVAQQTIVAFRAPAERATETRA